MTFNMASDKPVPERFIITQDVNGTQISWKWFSYVYIFLFVFSLFWFGFLAAFYAISLSAFGSEDQGVAGIMKWVFILFPLIHVAVGCGILYSSICGFVNQTSLVIDSEYLRIKHGPLPWPGNAIVPRSELKQLYVKQKISRTRNGVNVTYILYALNQSGQSRRLIKNAGENETQYLEYIIEKKLGIRNEPVVGEFQPGIKS